MSDDRVVVVSQQYPPELGGNASRVGDSARRLAAEGWDVTVLAPPKSYPAGRYDRTWNRRERTTDGDVAVNRLWSWQPTDEDPSALARLAYYLLFALHATLWLLWHRRRTDVVVCTTPPIFTSIPGLVVGALPGTAVVVDVGDLWIDAAASLGFIRERSLSTRLSRRYERLVLRRADRVLTTTDEMSRLLAEGHGPAVAAKLTVVPNAVDTERFTPGDGDDDGRTILYTGNFGHAQDLENCIRAMQYVETDARLLLVGDGDLRRRLVSLVAELDLGDRVEFRDPVEREAVPDLLRSAAVGVATLKQTEGLGYAVPTKTYEYLACGLPVVGTEGGALADLLAESGGGLAVRSEPEPLADAFETLLSDPDRRAAMGAAGREHVTATYDRRAVGRHLSETLEATIQ